MPYSNEKCCCNCQFWGGPRKVSAFKDKAEVRSMSDQGEWLNKSSAQTRGRSQRADHPSNCNHYEKWDQLK